MAISILAQAVESFAAATHAFTEEDLEREWTWRDYDEGLRYAFFRTYEELRELAANLSLERGHQGLPLTTAQRILSQYHAAYRDLQAVLIGVTNHQADQEPAPGEWPLGTVVTHIVQAERSFFGITRYGLDRARSPEELPLELSDEGWDAIWAGDTFEQMKEAEPLSVILFYYDALHERVLHDFVGIRDEELSAPTVYWETTPMPVQFRLHRFDSHLRQHTIQAEKTLYRLGLYPNETKRLLRWIYTALAEVEAMTFGVRGFGAEACEELAAGIRQRTDDICKIVAA